MWTTHRTTINHPRVTAHVRVSAGGPRVHRPDRRQQRHDRLRTATLHLRRPMLFTADELRQRSVDRGQIINPVGVALQLGLLEDHMHVTDSPQADPGQ